MVTCTPDNVDFFGTLMTISFALWTVGFIVYTIAKFTKTLSLFQFNKLTHGLCLLVNFMIVVTFRWFVALPLMALFYLYIYSISKREFSKIYQQALNGATSNLAKQREKQVQAFALLSEAEQEKYRKSVPPFEKARINYVVFCLITFGIPAGLSLYMAFFVWPLHP